MYGRKAALRIMILSMWAIVFSGCGEVQSGQPAPETAETFKTEIADISEDMTAEASTGQPEDNMTEASTEQPEDNMAEASTEQSEDDMTEPSTDQPEEDAVEPSESEEEEDSFEWTKLSVPTLPATGCELSDFVSEGWRLIDSVELNYNEDGITDYVGVQEVPPDEEKDGWWYFSPGFRILFGIVSEGPGQYRLDFQDENLIRTWDEGGAFGDPYEPLTVEGNSFTTSAYGGSSWKWSEEFTYTYRDGTWYLTRSLYYFMFGLYTTDYILDDWEKGVRTRKTRSTDFDKEKIWQMEEDERENLGYDLEYEMRLDEPPTLYQAGKRWAFSLDRVTDWEVSRIVLAEGIELSQEKIRMPDDVWLSGYNYHDENCVLYTFSCGGQDDQRKNYLAMYRWQDKSLNILAEEYSINEDMMQVYGDKIYYIAFYKSVEDEQNIVKEENDVIGVRLNRINLDGTGKEIIFDLTDKGMRLMDIGGGEIIVEVYEEGPNAVYRMDVDGGNLRQIGQIPEE